MSTRTAWIAAALLAAGGLVSAQDGALPAAPRTAGPRLEFSSRPVLIKCDNEPCFRMDLRIVDAEGAPVAFPDSGTVQIFEGGQEYRPFYRALLKPAGQAAAQNRGPKRVVLVVVDVSGSMKEPLAGAGMNKYDAARAAIRDNLVAGFDDNVDEMAIVPFDSRQVAERIKGGTFQTTRAGLAQQLSTLAPPRANTALYSAVFEGIKVLEGKRAASGADAQYTLVVFTDGKNDVGRPGDDPGLLGNDALPTVQDAARRLGAQIITIGLGDPGKGTFDAAALQAMKYPDNPGNYMTATNLDQLRGVFERVRVLASTGLRVTVGPVRSDFDKLANGTLTFRAKVGPLEAISPRWNAPAIGGATPESAMSEGEKNQFDRCRLTGCGPATAATGTATAPWWRFVRRVLVFAVYVALLAGLWFGLPRLLWPERYIPKPAAVASRAPARPGAGAARAPAARPGPQPPGRSRSQPTQREVTVTSRTAIRPAPGPEPPPRPAPPRGPSYAPRDRDQDFSEESAPQPRVHDVPPRRGGRDYPPPPREREAPAAPPPGRFREAPPAPPQRPAPPRMSPQGPREADDATVFIPPRKGPGPDER